MKKSQQGRGKRTKAWAMINPVNGTFYTACRSKEVMEMKNEDNDLIVECVITYKFPPQEE